jgi:hypothetical protein
MIPVSRTRLSDVENAESGSRDAEIRREDLMGRILMRCLWLCDDQKISEIFEAVVLVWNAWKAMKVLEK